MNENKELKLEEIEQVNGGGIEMPVMPGDGNRKIIDHGKLTGGESASKLPEGYGENGVRVS